MNSTTSTEGIGSRRIVVGAHKGVGAFLLQRLTAIILAAFSLLVVLRLVFGAASGYDAWAGIFVPLPMKIVTLVALLALFYHAWIGVRDIWMDYVKPTGVRLMLQTLSVLWLLFCAVWAVQILWRV
ncbi:MAG TPA: succinate dehydrogenase, hydrophobic membrane anchor protein [Burkholderiaceae bacterium]|nr:succinate dehydrogenase, hydrophobic membrane anchor protein [Burkholderiaceae bacterium]